MTTHSVVEHLDVFLDSCLGLDPGPKAPMVGRRTVLAAFLAFPAPCGLRSTLCEGADSPRQAQPPTHPPHETAPFPTSQRLSSSSLYDRLFCCIYSLFRIRIVQQRVYGSQSRPSCVRVEDGEATPIVRRHEKLTPWRCGQNLGLLWEVVLVFLRRQNESDRALHPVRSVIGDSHSRARVPVTESAL
jgi:hypothetical protein